MKKVLIAFLVFVFLVVVGAGVMGYLNFVRAKPLSNAELTELTPGWDKVTQGNWSPWFTLDDGTVEWNPAASFNAWLETIPEEDKAWPELIGLDEKHKDGILDHPYLGVLPNDVERWEILREDLLTQESEELYVGLQKELVKPILGCVLSDGYGPAAHAAIVEFDDEFDPGPLEYDSVKNQSLMEMMMGWLGTLNRNTKFLISYAALDLENGDTDIFVERGIEILESLHLIDQYPNLISHLVRLSTLSKCIDLIDWGMQNFESEFTDEQLILLDQAITRNSNFQWQWEGESLVLHDTIRRLCGKNGGISTSAIRALGDDFELLGQPIHLSDPQLKASSQRILLVYNQVLVHASMQFGIDWNADAIGPDEFYEQQKSDLPYLAEIFLDIMTPAFGHAAASSRQLHQRTVGLSLGIAAHRHRLRYGAFAQSIDEIDSDLLTFEPLDVFNGQQLKYTLDEDGQVKIYSVGPDRIDNGGAQFWNVETMEKLVIDGDELSLVEVDVRSKIHLEWPNESDAKVQYGPPNESTQSDWVLFPMPFNDPTPLDNWDWDYDDNLILKEED